MKKVGLFFGGISNEHDVSIISAKSIEKNFDYKKYKLIPIYWSKNNNFYIQKKISCSNNRKKILTEDFKKIIDIAFIITHGKYGEDGVLQSILESQKIKYTGCEILSSALCMDKAIFKKYLSGQGINQVKFEIIDTEKHDGQHIKTLIKHIKNNFKLPLFVKPSNSGSSIGISKVKKFNELESAIKIAKKHDKKIIIEEGISNYKEIEVAILGNKKLTISNPGELLFSKDFYDYDDKYKLGKTKYNIPAKLDKKTNNKIKLIAEEVYKLCDCKGFARIDFFVKNKKIYVNEINTIPGFTDISMFPKLMDERGIKFKNLINKIIELA